MGEATPDFGFWNDGVLSQRQLRELCNAAILTSSDEEGLKELCGESAIDLRITGTVYKLKQGSVKPFGPRYLENLHAKELIQKVEPGPDKSVTLEKEVTYLLPVCERLERRAQLWSMECYGQATAKSSIGRLDVLARLIVDGAKVYEGFTPECLRGSTGELFVEVTPITFPIKVRKGDKLTQLRFFKGSPSSVELTDPETSSRVLASSDRSLTVSLEPTSISDSSIAPKYVAFKAEREPASPHEAINLSKKGPGGTDPKSYWEPQKLGEDKDYFKIEKDAFYILRSAELISVPNDIAVYCRASDEAVGEMRIHYAGFVHPRFGLDRDDGGCGTPLIFEVRGHNVPVLLAHRERMATLVLYRMSEPYQGSEESAYGTQTLKLSNHFKPWTENGS